MTRPGAAPPRSGLDLLAKAPIAAPRGRAAQLRRLLLEPGRYGLGRRNRLSNFTFFLLAACGGSAASVVAAVLAAWALISMLLRRFAFRLERSDLPIVLSMLLFVAVMASSDIYHQGLATGFSLGLAGYELGKLALLALPVLLVPRLRCSSFRDSLPPAFLGAAAGGILLIPICLVDYLLRADRVAGLAGNPGPLSICALLAAGWSLLSLPDRPRRGQALFAACGCLGACLAVLLSGMRGAWPALPAILLVALFARRRSLAELWRRGSPTLRAAVAGLALVVLVALAVAVAPVVRLRIEAMLSDLSLIGANVDTATSLNLRRAMYEAAMEAFRARPWFGYGREAHWAAIEPYLDSDAFAGFSFSHLHNIFLTVGIGAGLVGIAALVLVILAPLWTAFRARRLVGGTRRLAAALVLVLAFLVPGLSNIMFFHDILDAVWAFAVALIAASVPAPGPGRAR
ncbi:hypothetical protein GCM10011390_36720 [Aureimonas endophytica]|uniref:O-antigen ligase-related domain-containing protein n=1 Tax=Aureimonas endophytica TaxID=2027858 RepID=A0A916ZU95_9HYPH|nr:O-antigen ligase family protein [Aureimonas endophytica]GGE14216.1 hypothetical protein GCM10011390_36720 [Aureimonas endophytica]